MAKGCDERAEEREPENQRKEIPAVEMSQKFYWTKCGLQQAAQFISPVKYFRMSRIVALFRGVGDFSESCRVADLDARIARRRERCLRNWGATPRVGVASTAT